MYEWDESKLIRETVTYKQTDKKYDIWYMYDANNNVIGFEYSQISELNKTLKTTRIYYEKNLQGDVIGLLDARGAEIAVYTYDAWGNIITDNGASFCYEGNEVPFVLNHILYRGYYYDGICNDTENDTNLYYLQSRYYDSKVGRFINADNFEYINTGIYSLFATNLYCYCNANPVNDSDPRGTFSLGAIKGLFKKCAKWLCQVNRFGTVLDIIIKVIPMGVSIYSSIKSIQTAKKLASKNLINRSRKVILDWMKNTLYPAIKKYISATIASICFGIITKIVDIVLTIFDTSLGKIIARGIDKVDSHRNNKVCFY